MSWKDRYTKRLLTISHNGIKIFQNGFYIIREGSSNLERNPVHDGFIVKINKVCKDDCSIWFNNNITDGGAYSWNGYTDEILRPATEDEIRILLTVRPELKNNPTG